MANDLIFKYGEGNMPAATADTAGTIYIKKSGNSKADMYVDSPDTNSQRLRIGSDVYVGDPEDTEANDYEVIINPNGDIIDNVVTGMNEQGDYMPYILRIVNVDEVDLDTYTPTDANSNIITFVIKK